LSLRWRVVPFTDKPVQNKRLLQPFCAVGCAADGGTFPFACLPSLPYSHIYLCYNAQTAVRVVSLPTPATNRLPPQNLNVTYLYRETRGFRLAPLPELYGRKRE
jgi:hypothetical protein